jgi:hypothetical protein
MKPIASLRRHLKLLKKVTRERFFSQHRMTFTAPRKKSLEMPPVPVLFEK